MQPTAGKPRLFRLSLKLDKWKILLPLLGFFLGFLFSLATLRGRTSPLGVAAVAAVPYGLLLPTLGGVLLGCLCQGTLSGVRFSAAALVLAGVRLMFFSSKTTREMKFFDPLLAASVIFSTGCAMYLSGDMDILFLLETALTFGSTYLLRGAVAAVTGLAEGKRLDSYGRVFLALTLLLAVSTTAGITLYGVSPVVLLLLLAVGALALKGDLSMAGFAGISAALALSLSGWGALGVAGGAGCLSAAFVQRHHKGMGRKSKKKWHSSPLFAFFGVGQVVLLCHGGDMLKSALSLTLATILLAFLPQTIVEALHQIFEPTPQRTSSPKSNTKILKTAHVIEEMVEDLVAKEGNPPAEIFAKTIEEHCKGCKKSHYCWGKDYNTMMNAVNDMSLLLKKHLCLTVANLPPPFRERCTESLSFAKSATAEYIAHAELLRKKQESRGEKDVLREHYRNFSAILEDLGDAFLEERERDPALEEELREFFMQKGANVVNLEATYNRHDKLQVSGNSTGSRPDLSGAAKMTTTLIKRRVSEPEIWKNNTHWHFVMNEEEIFRVAVERHISPAPNEKMTGDAVRDFRTDDMLYVTVLSDGMGAGRRAGEKSRLAVDYMEKLMQAGLRQESAMRVLNSALLVSPDTEVFATLDAAILDMYSGELDFVKAGAAPSFILRGKELAKVESRSLPAGLLPQLEAEIFHTRVQDGDKIILMSDGILPPGEDSKPLEEFIKSFDFAVGSLSRAMVAYAKTKYFGPEADDMTAVVLTVERKEERV